MSEVIKPPWTGNWPLAQLSVHPNDRVRAVAQRLLGPPFNYRPDDMFTGQLINRLCEFVDPLPGGRYDASRIQEGENLSINWYEQALGTFFVPAREWTSGRQQRRLVVGLGQPWQR